MVKATVEYVGFRTSPKRREYLLRSHFGTEVHEYTVGIALTAFAAGRVRLQDGPEICYLRLLRELESATPSSGDDLTITDAELADYVTAHTTPARGRGGFSAAAATAAPLKTPPPAAETHRG